MKRVCIVNAKYLRNPDVVLRDEDEDGGLLFNPDTNQILVLNPTAVCIWKTCESAASAVDVLAAVEAEFCQLPDEAADHVQKFMKGMVTGGYLCLVKE